MHLRKTETELRLKLSFLAEALGDYDAAVDYYIKISEIVTRRFVAEFDSSVEAVLANPFRWRKEGELARIYRMPNLPYSLIYRSAEEEMVRGACPSSASSKLLAKSIEHQRRTARSRQPLVAGQICAKIA